MSKESVVLIRWALITILTLGFTFKGIFDAVLWLASTFPDAGYFLTHSMWIVFMPILTVVSMCAYGSALALTNVLTRKKA